MRNFTPEEKELIVNTSITEDVFDLTDFCELDAIDCVARSFSPIYDLHCIAESCDHIRELYKITKDERLFTELVRLLPNSYKVVNLCAERKDICKAKHMVPETPHYGKESKAVPCYTMGSCNDCGLFAEYKRGGRK